VALVDGPERVAVPGERQLGAVVAADLQEHPEPWQPLEIWPVECWKLVPKPTRVATRRLEIWVT
jgi:hypothetical protein